MIIHVLPKYLKGNLISNLRASKNKTIKKKKEGANKAAEDLPGTGGTVTGPDVSSSSEEQSPFYGNEARSKRVDFQRLGAVKQATVFRCSSLGDLHETVEGMPQEQVR